MKLRITDEDRIEIKFKELYSLFEHEIIHRLLAKKSFTQSVAFRAFAGTSFMASQISVVSMELFDGKY
jgi:hypothetical protein